jgi:protein ImuA
MNMHDIPAARTADARWALMPQQTLVEVFATRPGDAGAVGFVLAHLRARTGPVLWVQDRMSQGEMGAPYLPGLRLPVLRVALSRPADVLTALEEGLRTTGLAAVVGEVWGDPAVLDFTATKRLAMRAETTQTPCWLIRWGAQANLSAARMRWRVSSLPSSANADDALSPGDARWQAELFRTRTGKPGTWAVQHDRAADRISFSATVPDGTLVENHGTTGRSATG